jgi:hypothetical protein
MKRGGQFSRMKIDIGNLNIPVNCDRWMTAHRKLADIGNARSRGSGFCRRAAPPMRKLMREIFHCRK